MARAYLIILDENKITRASISWNLMERVGNPRLCKPVRLYNQLRLHSYQISFNVYVAPPGHYLQPNW